jgi:hypothetical protein
MHSSMQTFAVLFVGQQGAPTYSPPAFICPFVVWGVLVIPFLAGRGLPVRVHPRRHESLAQMGVWVYLVPSIALNPSAQLSLYPNTYMQCIGGQQPHWCALATHPQLTVLGATTD